MRELATIQVIGKIAPIEVAATGEIAQNIEQAFVNGWRVVVQKGMYNVGDKIIFLEEDSIIPSETVWAMEHAPFMERHKWRVKIIKFNRMQTRVTRERVLPTISQGLVLPCMEWSEFPIGSDMTQLLGIVKYEEPEPINGGEISQTFPIFIPRTDEVRVQSYPVLLDELKGKPAYATMKYDGSSVTVWLDDDGTVHVASRNHERRDGNNYYWNAVRPYIAAFQAMGSHVAVQGEAYGEGIQGNPLDVKGIRFAAFSMYDRKRRRFVGYQVMKALCDAYDIPVVDSLYEWEHFDESMESLERMVTGLAYPNTQNPMEGLVIRPMLTTHSPTLGRMLSFKFINPDFLVKKG